MPNIPQYKPEDNQMSLTWGSHQGFVKAQKELGAALDKVQPIYHGQQAARASIANRFKNVDTNTSVRDSFSAIDYAFFRPGEVAPYHFRDVIASCMGAYEKVPAIHTVIDLMGDFCVQGIKIIHDDIETQNFLQEWFRTVEGEDRSERIANCLYRTANVIVKRANAKLRDDVVEDWKKTVGQNLDVQHEEEAPMGKNEIPYRYTILNPVIVEVLGEHMAAFAGKVDYVLKLPSTFYNSMSLPLTGYNPSLLTESLPVDIQEAMSRGDRYLLLDSNKLVTLFYKKDDWNVWAYPMIYPLLDMLIFLEKMKLADLTALDGVISHIRIWKLGSLEHRIVPTDAAISKLSNILLNHVAGGAMDFVWGPDLELTETSTDVAKFLGSEKYEFVMNTIHTGLGIPAAIGRTKGSMTDNFMSLRVLLERLKYGRRIVKRFWEAELKLVQKAMGFKHPGYVTFDSLNLDDEAAEKALWIRLVEEDLIPAEYVQEKFGIVPEMANLLMKRESKARDKGLLPPKAGPYHDPQPKLSLTKIFAQRGAITPSELKPPFNIDLKEAAPEHQEQLDSTFPDPMALKKAGPPKIAPAKKKKPKGKSGEGRPGGSKDSTKRKTRKPKPSTKATDNRLPDGEEDTDTVATAFMEALLYAGQAQKVIADTINPFFLEKFGKKNLRQLTEAEGAELEEFKFAALYNTSYGSPLTTETVIGVMNEPLEGYQEIAEAYQVVAEELRSKKGEELTFEQLTAIRSYLYAVLLLAEADETNE